MFSVVVWMFEPILHFNALISAHGSLALPRDPLCISCPSEDTTLFPFLLTVSDVHKDVTLVEVEVECD